MREEIIDGILHFELHGEFIPYSSQHLTTLLIDSRSREATPTPLFYQYPKIEKQIDVYPDNGIICCDER